MNLSRETFESIQKTKRPKRDPSCCGAVDAVGSDVGILFALQLLVYQATKCFSKNTNIN